MLFGHVQVALANGLRGDNPFSDACLIAMDYGRDKIIKDDWKSIFDDDELDHVLSRCSTWTSSAAQTTSGPSDAPTCAQRPPMAMSLRSTALPEPPQPRRPPRQPSMSHAL